MLNTDLEGARVVQLAMLTYEAQRFYPGLDGSFWHGVLDKGAKLGGVFLATKPPRVRLAAALHVPGRAYPITQKPRTPLGRSLSL